MPIARLNSATAPRTTSWVRPMKTSTPASGAATHGPTTSAERPPMTNTPANRPPGRRCVQALMRVCKALGICSSKTPNIDSDSAASRSANAPSTQRVLQRRCEAFAEEAGDDAEGRVDERHAERIRERQREAAQARLRSRLADDDRREDRHHRQHARRQRQQQPCEQEHADHRRHAARGERRLDAAGVARALRRGRGCRRLRRCDGCDRRRSGRAFLVAVPGDALDATVARSRAHEAGLRRIAQAAIGAALVRDAETEVSRGRARLYPQDRGAAQDLDVPGEVLVVFGPPGRQADVGDLRGAGIDFDGQTFAIQVVLRRDVEADLDRVGGDRARGRAEGIARLEIVGREGCADGEQADDERAVRQAPQGGDHLPRSLHDCSPRTKGGAPAIACGCTPRPESIAR